MEDRITYHHINENVINPDYVGVITTPMDDKFVFEDFREIPETITQIDKHIRDYEDLYEYQQLYETQKLFSKLKEVLLYVQRR